MLVSDVESAKKLLLHPNIDPNIIDHNDRTALMHACDRGLSEIVKVLLKDSRRLRKTRVNMADKDNKTALMIACEHGHVNVVHEIVASDKNVDIPNLDILAQINGCEEVMGYLNGYKEAKEGGHETVRAFLKANQR